ncbi:hypothetical protein B0T11DRAFT_283122 [Plectosphaerella cucumerina]|uniref:Uncharacterized protein n=1 Tax=Plectosphaerella cucumerina TaxID=40658 RepID=A0A8K0X1V9_9PEZI|nr:hypothetical protein B0T11DRAFT_283122 [Plectosphaerella cucumerina]
MSVSVLRVGSSGVRILRTVFLYCLLSVSMLGCTLELGICCVLLAVSGVLWLHAKPSLIPPGKKLLELMAVGGRRLSVVRS